MTTSYPHWRIKSYLNLCGSKSDRFESVIRKIIWLGKIKTCYFIVKPLSCHLFSVQWHLKNHRLPNCLLRDQIMLSTKLTRSVILEFRWQGFCGLFWEFRRFYFLLKDDLTLTFILLGFPWNSTVLNVEKCTKQREQTFRLWTTYIYVCRYIGIKYCNPRNFGMYACTSWTR